MIFSLERLEHSVWKRATVKLLECNEKDKVILSIQCEDCAPSLDNNSNFMDVELKGMKPVS